jgi:hypothetical protein
MALEFCIRIVLEGVYSSVYIAIPGKRKRFFSDENIQIASGFHPNPVISGVRLVERAAREADFSFSHIAKGKNE